LTSRFAWTSWREKAVEIVGVNNDGSSSVWRRLVFGLFWRVK
jgi:hypothetical protein